MSIWTTLPTERLLADYSLWSAQLGNLSESVAATEDYADLYHLDVADAHFVPGLLFFPDLVAALRPLTQKPFHVHLMTEKPETLVQDFLSAGADIVTVHAENKSAEEAIKLIRDAGKAVGLAVQLETPVAEVERFLPDLDLVVVMGTRLGIKGVGLDDQAAPRIREIKQLLAKHGLSDTVKVSADGGIRTHTVSQLRDAGADMITPGSLVFKSDDLGETTRWLHKLPAPSKPE